MSSNDSDIKDEAALITLMKEGDHEAFSVIVKRYKGRVFNTALRFLHNYAIAEELTQEIFITVFRKIGSFQGRSKFSTWLYRIAVNHAKNRIGYLKRRGHYKKGEYSDYVKRDELVDFTHRTNNPGDYVEVKQLMEILKDKISDLSVKDREIIILKDFEGLTYEEIGEILKISLGTVKSRLSRARQKLKDDMREYL